jgi:hypothetical protein
MTVAEDEEGAVFISLVLNSNFVVIGPPTTCTRTALPGRLHLSSVAGLTSPWMASIYAS